MLEAWFDDELIKPNTLTKKFGNARDTKHFYVLHVGWLAVYSAPVDTTDPSSREQRVSLIPLKVCTVSEELVVKEAGKIVSKKKEKPLSFHIDVNNPKRYMRSQRSRLLDHIANPCRVSQRERRAVQQSNCPSRERGDPRRVAG